MPQKFTQHALNGACLRPIHIDSLIVTTDPEMRPKKRCEKNSEIKILFDRNAATLSLVSVSIQYQKYFIDYY